jgi:hypothetical protein
MLTICVKDDNVLSKACALERGENYKDTKRQLRKMLFLVPMFQDMSNSQNFFSFF